MDQLRKIGPAWPSAPGGGRIAVVGEAPGELEEAQGQPLIGQSGKLLNSALSDAGLIRAECYIGNVLRYRPPQNDFESWAMGGSSNANWWRIEEGVQELRTDLAKLQPNVVVAVGDRALWALTGKNGIHDWRGSILPGGPGFEGLKIIPTVHPAYVFKVWNERILLVRDFIKAKREMEFPEIKRIQRQHLIEPSGLNEALYWLAEARKAPRLAVDIENRRNGYITVLGFADSPYRSWSIPFAGPGGFLWSIEEEARLWEAASALLADPGIEKIFQYGIHDRGVMAQGYHVAVTNFAHDTQVASKVLDPELPASLAFQASMWIDEPYWKSEGKSHDNIKNWPQYYTYNGKDCCATFEIAEAQRIRLKAQGLEGIFQDTMRTLDPLLAMGLRGIRVDSVAREGLDAKFKAASEGLLVIAEGVLGCKINFNSPAQMKTLLYERLGYLPVKKRSGDSWITTADDLAMAKCFLKRPDPALTILRAASHYDTLRNHTGFQLSPDGRARTKFNPVAETGRLGSSKWFDDTGYNLQNVPRRKNPEVRSQFVSDPGKWLISADLEKAEAMVVAWLSGDEESIRAFKTGADVHRLNAARIFSIDAKTVTTEQREIGKVFKHAGNYDIGPNTMWEGLLKDGEVFDLQRVKFLVTQVKQDRFIAAWHAWTRRQISTGQRVLRNPLGRVRQFLGRPGAQGDGHMFREALAQIPQSTVADVINKALARIAYEMQEEVELLLQVHDEIVAQTAQEGLSEAQARLVAGKMADLMRVPMIVRGIDGVDRELTIPVAWKIGRNWQECH